MCDGDKKCNRCRSRVARAIEINRGTIKTFDGRKVVVVPVVMAKGDVVMNGGLFPVDEYEPLAWNGIPVTVGHPQVKGSFASARDPRIHEEWVVGALYNVEVVDNSLRAEAYIDVSKADSVYPGLVNELVKGSPIDVSTGYYCATESEEGTINGREYHEVQRDVIPDHLALLPNEQGACNWEDGCGVRSNLMGNMSMKVRQALKVIANAVAAKPSPATVDEIIANKNSPYTEDDRESLTKMSAGTLNKIAASFANADDMEEEEEVDNSEDEVDPEQNMDDEEKKEMKDKKNARTVSTPVLSDDDREALQFARTHAADHRRSLVAKITGNTAMTEDQLKTFSLSQLTAIADGIKPVSYVGRAHAEAGEADDVADSMLSTGVVNALRAKRQKETA